MFTRIVKMEFKPENISIFLEDFEIVKHKIRNFEGCLHLQLWRDKRTPHIFFTHSHWQEESDLENYRHSDLFKGVWAKTKPLFQEKAAAWSVDVVEEVSVSS
jgi:heme-degrading monooxygenase HmoA